MISLDEQMNAILNGTDKTEETDFPVDGIATIAVSTDRLAKKANEPIYTAHNPVYVIESGSRQTIPLKRFYSSPEAERYSIPHPANAYVELNKKSGDVNSNFRHEFKFGKFTLLTNGNYERQVAIVANNNPALNNPDSAMDALKRAGVKGEYLLLQIIGGNK